MTENQPPQSAPYTTVVLLDALGARGLSLSDATRWLDSIRDVMHKIWPVLKDVSTNVPGQVRRPVFRVFGDTILLLWSHDENPGYAMLMSSLVVQQVFVGLLCHGIPARGAVACGEAVWDHETALGPAVTDAAEWYEKADWLGVIAAPSCAVKLDGLASQRGEGWVSSFYIKHDVPLKTKPAVPQRAWALSWPQELELHAARVGRQGHEFCTSQLASISRQPEHESKYSSSAAFFDGYMSEWARHSLRINEKKASEN
ncbi:MAG: hypothetical protein WCP21_03195 [Armatimonadota bacterium]